ncbi:hypothetical protein GUITHDRAFT_106330 [Guillardia theta CCMP2712]|uniref:Uncharacterized protein n=1 Tax=Guillardia theta (strain CCMP2712) TaxID=905079 RepID=L1JH17_GUITC|nr:hypothetical protein GUITHDRAFT_106330 [Guillardia theta CCMP2712]EKX47776.1 hypothetical protein GUITHDRAFT_106330 [Guillardia theta CCMP2712]|eukprot:XP_005834756.1 hypothetical protein GUITHDRAFT_106330 [Guillardia theta CCMP2712]
MAQRRVERLESSWMEQMLESEELKFRVPKSSARGEEKCQEKKKPVMQEDSSLSGPLLVSTSRGDKEQVKGMAPSSSPSSSPSLSSQLFISSAMEDEKTVEEDLQSWYVRDEKT